ncbi:hypothetical protein L2E82_48562 [Cichorium intybus]|uniref:Uncharacterized protein n=1 Tax=Cichorium intybus TaxID=13427 RepID=A0ACB8Z2K7_CICIN|nr:hypothetical protein L2E82_48562 [Cichorium intybus]
MSGFRSSNQEVIDPNQLLKKDYRKEDSSARHVSTVVSVTKDDQTAHGAVQFTFRELASATKNFHVERFLGENDSGCIYKGCLENTGQVVSVQHLNGNHDQGIKEFLKEVVMRSVFHHANLVKLIGYCVDGDHRLVVHEFMPLGSLGYHLHGPLLFESDVYSFGLVFLELITGRKLIDYTRPPQEQSLFYWARPLLKDERKYRGMVDPLLRGRYPPKTLHQALGVVAKCIQEPIAERPDIGSVVAALSYLASQTYEPNAKKTSPSTWCCSKVYSGTDC